MFKTVKRIIDWCGEFKGKLYLGFVMTFFSHIFAALPLALAAYTVGLLIESQSGGAAFDAAWIWKTIVIQIVLVLLRFLFDYLRARLQEPISYQLTAREREIVALMQEGRSNPEIGEALYVTRNMVKKHIQNIYEKLGVNSRKGLEELLEEQDHPPG